MTITRGLLSASKSLSIAFFQIKTKRNVFITNTLPLRYFCGCVSTQFKKTCYNQQKNHFYHYNQYRWYSKEFLDGEVKNILYENDLKRISEIFPSPRVTLNELSTKLPHKIFDIQYRQTVVTPKVSKSKRKSPQTNNWICSYLFVWPDKMKFESTALSKKQASENAAAQAIQYLYENNLIDKHGQPVYNRQEIDKITSDLNKPFCAEVGNNFVERIAWIWTDYEEGIKDIFNKTHEEAVKRSWELSTAVTNDSTVDPEDEISDDELTSNNDVTHTDGAPARRREARHERARARQREEIAKLPVDDYTEQITSALETSRTLILFGAAGCGKSTRVPPAVLFKYGPKCNAIVSEPRRVAAVSLAERVASEMGEEVGETIGYQVRLKAKLPRPPGGAVLYCTSGVLLRRLQTNPGLVGYTHVFIDEAHERDVNTDLSLLLLKRALSLNPELKVIVMSATLNADVFTRYFDGSPVIEIPGRTYPVEAIYLDEIRKRYNLRPLSQTAEVRDDRPYINCNEITQVIKSIDASETEGGILVFLPGWAEIKYVKRLLEEELKDSCSHLILPVHSRLSSEDQSKMFARPLPGVRKIVLSTNIAETSVTIPDIRHVLDCGAAKESRVLRTGISSLDTVWISQAAAKQRMGRAGRVQSGYCYKMYTKEKEAEFNEHTTAEILRVPLEQVVLACKWYAPRERPEQLLARLPQPPPRRALRLAVDDLMDLGALNKDESLTPLGHKISPLPLPPRISVSLLHSIVTCNVVSVAYSVGGSAVTAGEKSDIRELKRKYSQTSDHAALYYIQEEFEQMHSKRKISDFLRRDRLLLAKALTTLHLEHLLKAIPLRNTEEIDQINKFSSFEQLLVAVLLSGCDKLLISRKRLSTKGRLKLTRSVYTSTGEKVHISSESVNYNISKDDTNKGDAILIHCDAKHSAARNALVVNDTSLVSPLTVLLFARGDVKLIDSRDDDDRCILRLTKHNLEVMTSRIEADAILKAREMLWQTFQFYYERYLDNLDLETENIVFRFKMRLVKAVGKLLLKSDREGLDYDDE